MKLGYTHSIICNIDGKKVKLEYNKEENGDIDGFDYDGILLFDDPIQFSIERTKNPKDLLNDNWRFEGSLPTKTKESIEYAIRKYEDSTKERLEDE